MISCMGDRSIPGEWSSLKVKVCEITRINRGWIVSADVLSWCLLNSLVGLKYIFPHCDSKPSLRSMV
jgi:hypothetical protein